MVCNVIVDVEDYADSDDRAYREYGQDHLCTAQVWRRRLCPHTGVSDTAVSTWWLPAGAGGHTASAHCRRHAGHRPFARVETPTSKRRSTPDGSARPRCCNSQPSIRVKSWSYTTFNDNRCGVRNNWSAELIRPNGPACAINPKHANPCGVRKAHQCRCRITARSTAGPHQRFCGLSP